MSACFYLQWTIIDLVVMMAVVRLSSVSFVKDLFETGAVKPKTHIVVTDRLTTIVLLAIKTSRNLNTFVIQDTEEEVKNALENLEKKGFKVTEGDVMRWDQ